MSQEFMREIPALHVNVDHVATIRQARQTFEPDPVYAAMLAEQAGAQGITIHLREDRRHIQDRDLRLMKETVTKRLNLEMAATDEMIQIALSHRPDIVTLVPEKREEVTTEGGLEVAGQKERLHPMIGALRDAGIRVSLFIDPVKEQIEASRELGAHDIELHTGEYANARNEKEQALELIRLSEGAKIAHELGLQVNAGHGLTYGNLGPIARLPHLKELNIGHSIVSRAVMSGMEEAVREMLRLIERAVR